MSDTPAQPSPFDQAEDALGKINQVLSAGGGSLDATLAQLVSAYAVRDRQVQAVSHLTAQIGEHIATARAQAQPAPSTTPAPPVPHAEDAAPSASKSGGDETAAAG